MCKNCQCEHDYCMIDCGVVWSEENWDIFLWRNNNFSNAKENWWRNNNFSNVEENWSEENYD